MRFQGEEELVAHEGIALARDAVPVRRSIDARLSTISLRYRAAGSWPALAMVATTAASPGIEAVEVLLRVQCRHAAASGRGHRLPIHVIGDVSCREHALDAGGGGGTASPLRTLM